MNEPKPSADHSEAASPSAEDTPNQALGGAGHTWLETGLAVLGLHREIQFTNEELSAWLREPSAALIGRTFEVVLAEKYPDWSPSLVELWQLATPTASTLLCASEAEFPGWFRLEVLRNAAGWFVRLSSALPPLAALAEAPWHAHLASEQARRDLFVRLLRAESRLLNLEARWPGVIFSQRADFSFQYISPRVEELTGIPAEAWRRDPDRFWDLVHEADVDELRQRCVELARLRDSGASTFRIRHARTGRIVYLLEHRNPVLSDHGVVLGYEGAWLDVTRQTIAERRLSAAAWKETLAIITMGLAHDFSNIMAGILSLSETLLAQAVESHPFHEGLSLVRKGCLQASQITQRIAHLHHGKTGERQYHDLNELATELADLARKILPRRLKVNLETHPEPIPLYIDAVEFRQVALNLALNAADAMPQQGTLTFRTHRYLQLPTLHHVQGIVPHLPCACLSVRDSGTGIASRHLPFIFDPFFTTKPADKGSGLGLYNAKLFVEKHNGAISVESTEQVGTVFHVWLPQADFTESERVEPRPSSQRKCLLFVAEPGPMAEGTAEVLRVNGFYVVPAHTPLVAQELLRSGETHFDGVMALTTPSDQAALEFLAGARRDQTSLKVILQICGGDIDELQAGRLQDFDLVIAHDLSEDEFLRRIQTLLASPARA